MGEQQGPPDFPSTPTTHFTMSPGALRDSILSAVQVWPIDSRCKKVPLSKCLSVSTMKAMRLGSAAGGRFSSSCVAGGMRIRGDFKYTGATFLL